MSALMASKRLAHLELTVKARLLHRTSRRLSLTEAGSAYYEQCRQALDILDAADAAIGHRHAGARGQLKVSAPVWCANAQFAALLADYRRRCPDVIVDIHLTNLKVDLVSGGYDLALRATHEPSQALIARSLRTIEFRLVALARFLAQHRGAKPGSSVYDAILPNNLNLEEIAARFAKTHQPLRLHPMLRSDDTTLAYQAVRADMGVAFLPEWLIADDLAAGRLVTVEEDEATTMRTTLFAVYTSRQYMAPKLRTFIDFLSVALAP